MNLQHGQGDQDVLKKLYDEIKYDVKRLFLSVAISMTHDFHESWGW